MKIRKKGQREVLENPKLHENPEKRYERGTQSPNSMKIRKKGTERGTQSPNSMKIRKKGTKERYSKPKLHENPEKRYEREALKAQTP